LDAAFVDTLAERIDRRTEIEIVRTDGALYVTIGSNHFEGATLAKRLDAVQS
jgi:hypothetical protein